MDRKKLKDIFTYPKEGLSRKARWCFGLPLAFTFWVLLSMFLPSFGQSTIAQDIRMTVSYCIFMAILLLTVKYFNGFSLPKMFCQDDFKTKAMLVSFSTMMASLVVTYLLIFLFDRSSIRANAQLGDFDEILRFVLDAIISFNLLSAASLFEELVFRSYIVHFLKDEIETEPRKQFVYCIVSGALFAAVHWSNPEVSGNGVFWAMPFYFIMGCTLMMMVFWTKGIEASLGMHLANNLVAAWFVSYDSAVLPTNSLFIQNYGEGALMLVQSLVCMALTAFVVYRTNNEKSTLEEPNK